MEPAGFPVEDRAGLEQTSVPPWAREVLLHESLEAGLALFPLTLEP